MIATPATITTAQTTGRHRGDGGCPSGKRRNNRHGAINTGTMNSQLVSQAASSAPGRVSSVAYRA
jgi:hypothetical protein